MNYNKYTGIILKKQNYKEADQILTIWTRENGKIRCLARGLRRPTSKLAYNLQDLSFISFELAGARALPTLISSQTYKSFKLIKEDLGRLAAALVASELMLKMTADEQPNAVAFDLLVNFYDYLSRQQVQSERFNIPLQCFSLKLLSILGFGLREGKGQDHDLLKLLQKVEFAEAEQMSLDLSVKRRLHDSINSLVVGVLERDLKSQAFLLKL
jgi:DNA repair protein RecO (recombination protein O)